MADLEKTVKIIFGGEDQLSRLVRDVAKPMGDLGNVADKLTAPLAEAGKSILKIDAALAALAIGGMAYAIKQAGEFGGAFGEITTLISDTGPPIDKFRRDILDYSIGSVKSIADINAALYASISAGVDYSKSLDFVKEAEKLSVAGRADLGATTKTLISTLNAYGESVDKAGKYSDLMFTTVRVGQTTMEELSSSLAQVTGLAANAGMPFATL